jgi:hypothetical protein
MTHVILQTTIALTPTNGKGHHTNDESACDVEIRP